MPPILKVRYRSLWAIAALAGGILLAVMLYVATGLEAAAKRHMASLVRANAELRQANVSLASFDDDAVGKARAQADMFRATLLRGAQVENFRQSQQTMWRVSEQSRERTLEYEKVRFELIWQGASMTDWPRMVEAVQGLQCSPGMAVRSVEILTSGDTRQRTFEKVALGVTLFVRFED